MKKVIFLGLIILLSLSACMPSSLKSDSQGDSAEPVSADIEATVEAAVSTRAAETFAALASPTMNNVVPATNTPSATATKTTTPTETTSPTATETPTEIVTTETVTVGTVTTETLTAEAVTTITGTPATETPEGTPPVASATSVFPSPTSPINANQPPDYIPRYKIKIVNNTKLRVYISLQGTTVDDYHPVTEYDLSPWEQARFPIPEGKYAAVVYVGKDPMVEYFSIHDSGITIIIEKNKLKFR